MELEPEREEERRVCVWGGGWGNHEEGEGVEVRRRREGVRAATGAGCELGRATVRRGALTVVQARPGVELFRRKSCTRARDDLPPRQ